MCAYNYIPLGHHNVFFSLTGWSRSTGQPVFIFSDFDPFDLSGLLACVFLTSLRVGGFIGGALEEVVRLGWI